MSSEAAGVVRTDPAALVLPQLYELVAPDTLEPHPDNPHLSDDELIGASIELNGFFGAVLAQKSRRRVLAGHGRLRKALELGAPQVPVIFVDVDDDAARDIMLADNKSVEGGTYDERRLAELLSQYSAGELAASLYSQAEVDELLRTTGLRGEMEAEFLQSIAGGEHAGTTQHSVLAGEGELDSEPEPAQFVVPVEGEQRDELILMLRALQERRGLATMSETILAVVREAYVASEPAPLPRPRRRRQEES